MSQNKKVLVYGTGFAGQGHTAAFRDANAEVVGIVGRSKEVTEEVALKLNIPYAGTDWQTALEVCKPDIVSIATPGGAHVEAIKAAINFGCHIFCDKPLTESGETAEEIYQLSVTKNVKTAFAASFRYMPEVMHAKQLIASGVIGEPREMECISHFNLDPHIPFGWSHTIAAGGGRLNNNFTHLLSIATSLIGENIIAINGEIRNDMPKAPVVEGVHNFTERRNFIPEDINDPELEWKEADVEWSYNVLAQLESDYPAKNPVTVLFKHGGLTPRFHDDHLLIHGSKASIYIKGNYGAGPLYISGANNTWEEIKLPQEISDSLPDIKDDTLRSWTHLAIEFVKDISGEKVEPYQTFEDGCKYQKIIDLIRRNDRWVSVSELM